MIVNGHKLPDLLSQCLQDGTLTRNEGSWQLKCEQDGYGHQLETELAEIFSDKEAIETETAKLLNAFVADGDYGSDEPSLQGPGAIPDILDFANIVSFAASGDGSPFCLDYRGNVIDPSVIWWDDCYWRRVTPTFAAFFKLWDLES